MAAFLLRRLITGAITIFAVATLCFVLTRTVKGSPFSSEKNLHPEIIKRPDYRGGTYLATYYYSFNTTDPALKDKRVRKALALAVDREILTTKITKQGQTPAFHLVPPIFDAYKSPRLDDKD